MMGVLGYIDNGTFRLPPLKSGSDMRASVLTWIWGLGATYWFLQWFVVSSHGAMLGPLPLN